MYTELLKMIADYKARSAILQEPSKGATGSTEIATNLLQNELQKSVFWKIRMSGVPKLKTELSNVPMGWQSCHWWIIRRRIEWKIKNHLTQILNAHIVTIHDTKLKPVLKTQNHTSISSKCKKQAFWSSTFGVKTFVLVRRWSKRL